MAVVEKARPGGGGPPPRAPGGRRRWLLLLALVAALAALWWIRDGGGPPPAPAPAPARPAEPHVEPDVPPAAVPAPERAGTPRAEPPAEARATPPPRVAALPPLGESDALARELAASVSRHALLGALLAEAGLIERFVVAVDNLAEGLVPRRALRPLVPEPPLLVLGEGPELRLDPASYRRFDAVTAAIASLDARAAVAAYRRVAPLCEESYRALGYPEGGFEQRLRAALALLLSTPTAEEAPALVAETLRYEFADPALENLTDAQKLLLRLGPGNGERVRAKLEEIQAALQ